MSRACDLIVSGGIFFILLFTPLAFGAVHPWAYIVMESAIFVSLAAAMIKLIYLRRWPGSLAPWSRRLAFPFLLFSALIGFQLLPIPPTLLFWLSPNGYTLYQTTLPGWPEKPPFADLLQAASGAPIQAQLLPTPDQLRQGVTVPFDTAQRVGSVGAADITNRTFLTPLPSSWRTLSIAPELTLTDLLKFVAYGSLFFLIGFYPFGAVQPVGVGTSARGQRAEAHFLRSLFLILLACGFIVALIGIIQRFTDNGKVLWFFIPYDWELFSANLRERASGPFINPNHFANYLTLIFPIALVYALRPPPWFAPSIARGLRIVAGVTALVIFLAILLSLSRFGWFAALLVVTVGLWLTPRGEISPTSNGLFQRRGRAFAFTATVLMLLLAVSIWVIGPQARQAIDLRLAESVSGDGGLGSRVALWHDSLKMIRDFPMLGVGLGAWSDLFPRYQRPSTSETFYREAHNDYVQLLAEAGLIGFMLLGLGLCQCARIALGALPQVPAHLRSVLVACIAALALMLLHELCDFSLKIPANAVLFTVILGVTLRLAAMALSRQRLADRELKPWLPASALAFAVGLIVVAFGQNLTPFPYNLHAPNSVAQAAERITAHPAQAVGHVMLARLIAQQAPLTRQTQVYATAAWLNPSEPNLRDMYASALLRAGRREPGLKEISQSVAMLPSMTRHFYLHDRVVPWLGADEKAAIEAGFQQALARGDISALENLALFYERTGQPLAQAKLFNAAAARSTDRQRKMELTLKAAESLIAAGRTAEAEQVLRHAVTLQPSDARPYQALALSVYAPQGQRDRIAAVIGEGIGSASQPFPLYLVMAESMRRVGATEEVKTALGQANAYISAAAARGEAPTPLFLQLADTANKVGALDDERFALEKAAETNPAEAETLKRLGNVYLRGGQYDRAAQVLQRLTELRPQSAEAFFYLAQAEEARYSYSAADAAYSRAAKLAPDPKWFQARRDEFKQKLGAALTANGNRQLDR